MFKKIVVPVDGSENSMRAVEVEKLGGYTKVKYTPLAGSDPDGDPLIWSVSGRPAWLQLQGNVLYLVLGQAAGGGKISQVAAVDIFLQDQGGAAGLFHVINLRQGRMAEGLQTHVRQAGAPGLFQHIKRTIRTADDFERRLVRLLKAADAGEIILQVLPGKGSHNFGLS